MAGTIFGCTDDSCEFPDPIEENSPPVLTTQTFTVEENSPAETLIGQVVATDPDEDTLTYSILNQSPETMFRIDENTGNLYVEGDVDLDFERVTQYLVTVSVSDGEYTSSGNMTVSINNVSEEFTITLQPGAEDGIDAALYSFSPNNNYGTHPQVIASAWTNGGSIQYLRSLIKFDLSAIPSDAKIVDAKLSLYHHVANNNPGHSRMSGSNESTIYKIAEDWSEDLITWNNQPSVNENINITVNASDYATQDYLDLNVLDLIADANGNQLVNYGFMLKLNTEAYYRSLVFASSDISDSSKHPKLEITFIQ
jgi:hypothetical protein